jgi:hypothetical protein
VTPHPTGRRGPAAVLALAVALVAGGILIARGPGDTGPPVAAPAPGRLDAATAWPSARTADIDPAMPDGPLFTPALFLDATTAIGTAPTPDGTQARLLIRAGDDPPRELRRESLEGNPQFDAFAAAGDDIVWAESGDRRPGTRIWAAARSGGAARQLTADTGNAVFAGNEFDLVIADGRVHWAAAPRAGTTEIRSVALTGGPVTVRAEPGEWSQTAWPWLTDETEHRLRNTATGRTVLADPAADGAFTKGGMLWWSTGDQDTIVWHTLDLRTA